MTQKESPCKERGTSSSSAKIPPGLDISPPGGYSMTSTPYREDEKNDELADLRQKVRA